MKDTSGRPSAPKYRLICISGLDMRIHCVNLRFNPQCKTCGKLCTPAKGFES